LSSGGDQVRLFDADGALIDSVAFGIASPWPAAAAGQGPTLELRGPALDNHLASSWAAATGYGTPGAQNSAYTSVALPTEQLPERLELMQNWPNPFNATTRIAFTLPAPADIRLQIFSVQGRCIRTLAAGRTAAGAHRLDWDGRDEAGLPASSGLYLCLLQSGEAQQVKRMLLLR